MIAAFVMAAAALVNQAYIQIYPAQYVNLVMNTTTLDSGDFWMMPQPEMANAIVAVVILLFFAGCYLELILFAVFFRHRVLAHETHSSGSYKAAPSKRKVLQRGSQPKPTLVEAPSEKVTGFVAMTKRVHDVYIQFVSLDGIYNKYYVSRSAWRFMMQDPNNIIVVPLGSVLLTMLQSSRIWCIRSSSISKRDFQSH